MTPLRLEHLRDPIWLALVRALGGRCFLLFWTRSLVSWAGDALCAGWDTPALRVLAGLGIDPDREDVERQLRLVLDELGVEVPSPPALAALYARVLATDGVNSVIPPRDVSWALWRIHDEAGDQAQAVKWLGLWDEWDLAEQGTFGSVEEVEARIIAEARRIADGLGGELDR